MHLDISAHIKQVYCKYFAPVDAGLCCVRTVLIQIFILAYSTSDILYNYNLYS